MGKEKQKSYKGFRLSKSGEFLSFTHTLDGKKVRIGHSQGFPQNIFGYNEAVLAKERLLDSLDRSRKNRENYASWVKQFNQSHKDLKEFRDWREKKGVEYYKSEYGHLKNHVFPFFLVELHVKDPQQWHIYFDEFKEWLDEREPLRNNSSNAYLSDNTKNNIIRAMHAFFDYLERFQKVGPFRRCDLYDESGFRGIDELIDDDENRFLQQKLAEISLEHVIYWRLLHRAGLRPNEGLGLHLDSIIFGSWPKEEAWAGEKIIKAGYQIYGYIYLKDQPKSYSLRDKNGHVARKPLKSKKKISPENSRIIPILGSDLAKDLLELKKRQKIQYEKGAWGSDREDYLLFGFTYQQIATLVRRLFDEYGDKRKSLYCLRHTFITDFSDAFGGDTRLAEIVVGHSDEKMMLRYNKLRQRHEERMKLELQNQDLDELEIKAVQF